MCGCRTVYMQRWIPYATRREICMLIGDQPPPTKLMHRIEEKFIQIPFLLLSGLLEVRSFRFHSKNFQCKRTRWCWIQKIFEIILEWAEKGLDNKTWGEFEQGKWNKIGRDIKSDRCGSKKIEAWEWTGKNVHNPIVHWETIFVQQP